MKMAMKEGQILIKDADNTQFTIIKSWSKMKWSRAEQSGCFTDRRKLSF